MPYLRMQEFALPPFHLSCGMWQLSTRRLQLWPAPALSVWPWLGLGLRLGRAQAPNCLHLRPHPNLNLCPTLASTPNLCPCVSCRLALLSCSAVELGIANDPISGAT